MKRLNSTASDRMFEKIFTREVPAVSAVRPTSMASADSAADWSTVTDSPRLPIRRMMSNSSVGLAVDIFDIWFITAMTLP